MLGLLRGGGVETWDVDDEALLQMEQRLDAEGGWDTKNDETFGSMEAFAWPDDEEAVGSEYEVDGVDCEGGDGEVEVAAEPEGEQLWVQLGVPASRDPPTRRLRRLRDDVTLAVGWADR